MDAVLSQRLLTLRWLSAAVVGVTLPLAATATPPCMPPACAPSGSFDSKACEAKADWIAEGRIDHVVHHHLGQPFNTDQFEFDFVPERIERAPGEGGPSPGTPVHYGVGWCNNPAPRLGDAATRYRVYGAARPSSAPADLPNEYFWIETIP